MFSYDLRQMFIAILNLIINSFRKRSNVIIFKNFVLVYNYKQYSLYDIPENFDKCFKNVCYILS